VRVVMRCTSPLVENDKILITCYVRPVHLPCWFFTNIYLLQYVFFFWKRDKKGVCESGDGKELEKCRELSFFFSAPSHETDRLFIFTNCNPTLNCNEHYKEEIGHDNNTLWKSNQSTISIKIKNIDSNH